MNICFPLICIKYIFPNTAFLNTKIDTSYFLSFSFFFILRKAVFGKILQVKDRYNCAGFKKILAQSLMLYHSFSALIHCVLVLPGLAHHPWPVQQRHQKYLLVSFHLSSSPPESVFKPARPLFLYKFCSFALFLYVF